MIARRMILAAILTCAVVFGTAAACDSPRGTPCDEEGAQMFTSKYGNFVCRDGWWHEA